MSHRHALYWKKIYNFKKTGYKMDAQIFNFSPSLFLSLSLSALLSFLQRRKKHKYQICFLLFLIYVFFASH